MTTHLTPRQYDLLLTRSQKFAVAAPLILVTLFPLIFYFAFYGPGMSEKALSNAPPFFPAFPLVFIVGFAIFYGWNIASLPYRISVTNDQRIVFKSLARAREVRVADLISIEPRSLYVQAGVSGYLLKHRSGKIQFPGQFTGQHVLLYELKRANPALELRGC